MAIEIKKEFGGKEYPVLVLNEDAPEEFQVYFGISKLRVILDNSWEIKNYLWIVKDGSHWEELEQHEQQKLRLKTVKGKMMLDITPEKNFGKPFLISEHQAKVIEKNMMAIIRYCEAADTEGARMFNQYTQEAMDKQSMRKWGKGWSKDRT